MRVIKNKSISGLGKKGHIYSLTTHRMRASWRLITDKGTRIQQNEK
jgi:hypothetical protein